MREGLVSYSQEVSSGVDVFLGGEGGGGEWDLVDGILRLEVDIRNMDNADC